MVRKIGIRKGTANFWVGLFFILAKPFAMKQVLIENEIMCSPVARELRPARNGCIPNIPGFTCGLKWLQEQ